MIFWDIENIPLWKRFGDVSEMTNALRRAFDAQTVSSIIAVGSLGKVLPLPTLADMQRHGIRTLDCSLGHSNAADLVLVTEMMRCLIETRPRTVCLVSNDGGFAHAISTVRQLGFNTVIMHDRPSKHLSQVANTSIDLRAITPYRFQWKRRIS